MWHEEGLLPAKKPVSFTLLFAYSSRPTGHRPAPIIPLKSKNTEKMSTNSWS